VIEVESRQTSRQTARGAHVDYEDWERIVLIKHVPLLRATYPIRVLARRAQEKGKTLEIQLPNGARLHRSLLDLRRHTGKIIKVTRS